MSGDPEKTKEHEEPSIEEPTVEEFLGKLFAGEAVEEEEALATKNLLAMKLRAQIRADGPLSLHDYMQACLADPEYGYYLVREPFGVGGDFITAPDICQVFGELLGLWCVHVWAELGQPKNCKLIELGPGRGALMSDALRAVSLVPECVRSIDVHFVETSTALRTAQKEHIEGQAKDQEREIPALFWHDDLSSVPDGPTFLIANEFMDALPIRQFQMQGGQWFERQVGLDGEGGFAFGLAEQPLENTNILPPIHEQGVEGDFIEFCPAMSAVIGQMAARAKTHPFAGGLIDYGYGQPALGDTFQAISDHKFTDPLKDPGLADVTAHVDFSQLLRTAEKQGLTVFGAATQRDFLIALGVRERAAQLMQAQENMISAQQFLSGFQRLVDRDKMGELFKVAGLAGADQPALPGFEKVEPTKREGL
ncbi:MAG: SAM-dependent methyltransferase [Hyphomicrobiaceae bacterium]|nr:SAM-dependent methyltransferase [Hyphomicrobiaceae bacterium]